MPSTTTLTCPMCGHRGEAFHCMPGPETNYCMLFHLYFDHEDDFTPAQRMHWSSSSLYDTLPGEIDSQEALNAWFVREGLPTPFVMPPEEEEDVPTTQAIAVHDLMCPICGQDGLAIAPGIRDEESVSHHMYRAHQTQCRAAWGRTSNDDCRPIVNVTDQVTLEAWCRANGCLHYSRGLINPSPTTQRSRMESNRYFIEEVNGVAGIFRQSPPVRVSGAEKILEAVALNMGCAVNGAFMCGERTIRLNCKQGYIVMSCPIAQLNLKTTFSIRNGFLVPEFIVDPSFLSLNLPWPVPPTMKMYFAVKAQPNQWRPAHACLFVRIEGQPGSFRMPISNTYADGRICLGRSYGDMREPTLQGVMEKSLTLLDNASWNADLMEDGWSMNSTRELFKFKADDRTPVYYPTPATLCIRCNNSTIEEAL